MNNETNPNEEESLNVNDNTIPQDNTKNTENTGDSASAEGESWEEKYKKSYDDYLRLFAEFDNFRRRAMKEKSALISSAGSEILTAILPVLDDFDRAMITMDSTTDISSLKQGVELIHQKLKDNLHKKGLKEIIPTGEFFDADLHESITQIPAPDPESKGKIVDVVEKGYKMNDKILRYPKVIVAQ
jgi:molecular chaperone GrpE